MTDQRVITDISDYHALDHAAIQDLLTVREIMTPRHKFMACTQGQSAREAFAGTPDAIDALPVVDGNDPTDLTADVVGIVRRADIGGVLREQSVSALVDEGPLSSAMDADLSLLTFVQQTSADTLYLFRDAGSIVGLATIEDVGRLSVRIALFAAIIDLEQLLSELLRRFGPPAEDWPALMPQELREQCQRALRRSSGQHGLGDPCVAVGFSEKLALLRHVKRDGRPPHAALGQDYSMLVRLRNDVAHAGPFQDNPDVPKHARHLLTLVSACRAVLGSER